MTLSSPAPLNQAPFDPDPCLYDGKVVHARQGEVEHRLSYRVGALLLPLYKKQQAARMSRFFSVNRFNLMSFHESDHMDEGFETLEDFVTNRLEQSGQFGPGEPLPRRISILCFPRMLGHAFNPISILFCCDDANQPVAILYQVSNTFGERHHYLYRLDQEDTETAKGESFRHSGEKNFYVSPFLAMDGRYDFSIQLPDEKAIYRITMSGNQPSSLTASFAAQRLTLSNTNLLWLFGKLWQTGWKILVAIHLEALRLWLKGAPYHRRPPLPSRSVSTLSRPLDGKGTPT
ncbi:hypothetical protein SAMN04515647_4565 [Cohaesibacter sp. ES.047]|uniref:DUF1365 domain-containing protein n=1 Tax=Cohaesibacter sp. ES.047 TaxID=1798205 RepID=UPI000BB8F6F4|nr:DUF1365 domain-containing protein [Cohaesibacter sp. ES.047]SNY94241.1 hypothetical protein SAMN04515647_4565 [Cohaesibacter sp. ES.047]